jgi:polysaccharide export outer membrane protein
MELPAQGKVQGHGGTPSTDPERMKQTSSLILTLSLGISALLTTSCIRHNPDGGVYAPKTTQRLGPMNGVQVQGDGVNEAYVKLKLEEGEIPPTEQEHTPKDPFEAEMASSAQSFTPVEDVRTFSEEVQVDYKLGPGDRFAFLVRGRPDISREGLVVTPDGQVALPRVGVFTIEGMTLNEATEFVREKLSFYYDSPDVTLALTEINNNKVFVLGRVANPGAVHFDGDGSLLEALALAGGLPADTRLSFLSRCMIVRGNDMLIWIDLRELLERGNLNLNTRLQNGDFIYIPQSEDQLAYIMGEVPNPGVLVLRSQMTLLDAVMRAGGPTLDSDDTRVYLIRSVDGQGHVRRVTFRDMYQKGDLRQNYVLKDGDIVYVSRSRIGGFNAFLTQMTPGMDAIDFTINTAEAFGAMQELRNKVWGQEGFVNRTSE